MKEFLARLYSLKFLGFVVMLVCLKGRVGLEPIPVRSDGAWPVVGAGGSAPSFRVKALGPTGLWIPVGAPLPKNSTIQIEVDNFEPLKTSLAELEASPASLRAPAWLTLLTYAGFTVGTCLLFYQGASPRPKSSPQSERHPEAATELVQAAPASMDQREKFGSFLIRSDLGEGACASVYLAESAAGVRVALKVLSDRLTEESGFQTRFEREAQLCCSMDHPRIVKTYEWGREVGDHGPQLWMAQQYIPGQTLAHWVTPQGLHPQQVRKMMIQICEGLEYAHGLGIFHRDLKPANIFADAKANLLIGDFGMARSSLSQTITQTGSILGTPVYMAPEQVEGRKVVDGRADLYSLGVIGYELLTGHPPFEGELVKILTSHLSKKPVPPRQIRPQISEAMEALVMRLLAKKPEDRFETASHCLAELHQVR